MSKRTPEETLAAVEAQFDEDEMDDVLAMTPEARRRELAAAGFDLDAADAKARALHAAATAPARPPGTVTPIRRRSALRVVMLLAAVFAIAAIAAVLVRRDTRIAPIGPDNNPFPWETRSRPQREAAELRHQAAAACEAKDLAGCIERLDQARDLDPAGDTSPEAQAIHDRIDALQREKPKHEDKHDKPAWP